MLQQVWGRRIHILSKQMQLPRHSGDWVRGGGHGLTFKATETVKRQFSKLTATMATDKFVK